jgi:hypothetical protein
MTEECMAELYLLRQIKHFRSHLRHRFSDTVNQVSITRVNVRSNDFNTINRSPWITYLAKDHFYTISETRIKAMYCINSMKKYKYQ